MQIEARYVEIEHASNLPRFTMAFHSVDGADPAAPAMSMISSYLSSGRASRLDQLLVETKMVYGVGAWDQGGIDPGMFNISVTMNSPEQCEVTIEEVQDIIWNELEYISENGISEETLEELKNRYRAREILGDANPVGLAMGYSLSTTMFGDPMYSQKQLELVEQLTSEDIQEAASACFRRNGVNIAVLSPVGGRGGMGGGENQQLPTDVTEPSSVNYDGLEIPEEFLIDLLFKGSGSGEYSGSLCCKADNSFTRETQKSDYCDPITLSRGSLAGAGVSLYESYCVCTRSAGGNWHIISAG